MKKTTFTAEVIKDDQFTGVKITCKVAGEYHFINDYGQIFDCGKVWEDENGNLFILERFMRKYIFYPYNHQNDPRYFITHHGKEVA
jgi:glutamate-1-semialdehyde aminotransferase